MKYQAYIYFIFSFILATINLEIINNLYPKKSRVIAQQQIVGRIIRIRGKVWLNRLNNRDLELKMARENISLFDGDILELEPKAKVEIKCQNGKYLDVEYSGGNWPARSCRKPGNGYRIIATKKPDTVYTTTLATRILQKGDGGEEVRILQERLRVAGYYYGNVTGIFGSITEDAVKRFQKAYNLPSDGIVTQATLRRLPSISVGYGEEVPQPVANSDKLRLGDRGEAVRVLQEQLIKAGYLEGEPNGYYGLYTADAVRRFQAENYLAGSGIAGPTTRAKLYGPTNGASNEFNVLEIQRRLRERGFYRGPLNGVMGNDTKRAIKQAQEYYGVSLSDIRD
jgi:peptidoglycan hydrolase-like protein with peptidoglycan-binding domain